jgi:hypothetical protein
LAAVRFRAVAFLRAGAFRAVVFLRAVDFRAVPFLRAVDFRAVVFFRAVDFRAVVFLRAGAFRAVVFLRAVDFLAVDRFFVAFLAPEAAFLAGLTMPPFVNAVLYAWLLPMKAPPYRRMPSGRGPPVGSPSALVQELLVRGAR